MCQIQCHPLLVAERHLPSIQSQFLFRGVFEVLSTFLDQDNYDTRKGMIYIN